MITIKLYRPYVTWTDLVKRVAQRAIYNSYHIRLITQKHVHALWAFVQGYNFKYMSIRYRLSAFCFHLIMLLIGLHRALDGRIRGGDLKLFVLRTSQRGKHRNFPIHYSFDTKM